MEVLASKPWCENVKRMHAY